MDQADAQFNFVLGQVGTVQNLIFKALTFSDLKRLLYWCSLIFAVSQNTLLMLFSIRIGATVNLVLVRTVKNNYFPLCTN